MIVCSEPHPLLGDPLYYAACLDCGWCGRMRATEVTAGLDDDAHLAAKLEARETPCDS